MSGGTTRIWEPRAADVAASTMGRFMEWLGAERGLEFDGYEQLWQWSVDELEDFWDSVWRFYGLRSPEPYATVLNSREMPGAEWFRGARLNYAEEVLRRASPTHPALIAIEEGGEPREISAADLRGKVGALAAALAELGVGPGDRVVGYLPNIEEAVVSLLATASLGAVWSVCSPDFGAQSVIDRFSQLEPKVLIAVDGYRFRGREFDRLDLLGQLQAALPSLEATILVKSLHQDGGSATATGALPFEQLTSEPREPAFASVPFDHPLWVLFSSGTTGLPKGIVHGHGGIVVEHLKGLGLCADIQVGDRWFLHSSTSWMAWNYLVGGLLHGASIVLYDGSPGHPGLDGLWQVAAKVKATALLMGCGYVLECLKAGIELDRDSLSSLRLAIPTGSPLPTKGWEWLHDQLGGSVRIDSFCGGTDVCAAYFGGNPLLPVNLGEIACRWLGVHAEAWDPDGNPLVDEVGEFVITKPMPSMPLHLWNDPEGTRYQQAYFDTYPGVWRQGDWITISSSGTIQVWGRSDATLNRGGVRLGSAEIYTVVEGMPEIRDSLVAGVELPEGDYYMPLFIVTAAGQDFDERLREAIVRELRTQLSPRHVPDEVIEVAAIPRTLTGKKLEVPIKRIIQGTAAAEAVSAGSIDDFEALAAFEQFARVPARGSQ
jgi:acetoacetyl-CoA synthetase